MARKKQEKAAVNAAPENTGRSRPFAHVRRVLKRLAIVLAVLAAIPLVLTPIYRFIDPPLSALMVWRWAGGTQIDYRWRDFDDIDIDLPTTILMSEDAKFCSHSGVDWDAVRIVFNEIENGGSARGASTISMQVVKNLFLWPSRSYVRKFLEVPLAYYADFLLGKRRLMEIYLNIVEWGPGIFGAEAAAQHHFGKAAASLSRQQAARLTVVLPNPLGRSASDPDSRTRRRAHTAQARARGADQWTHCLE